MLRDQRSGSLESRYCVQVLSRLPVLIMTSKGGSAETIEIAGITMSANPGNRPFPDLTTIKAVLFDVDGTLTNSDPLHFDAFHDILLEYGYKVGHCTVPLYCWTS